MSETNDTYTVLKNADVEQIVRDVIRTQNLSVGFDPRKIHIELGITSDGNGGQVLSAQVVYDGTRMPVMSSVNINLRESLRLMFTNMR